MQATIIKFINDPSRARSETDLYSLIFFCIGIASIIINLLQQTIFIYIGESITEKIRSELFLKILKMPIKWLEKPRNKPGILSTRLVSDCQKVNTLVTTYISIISQSLSSVIAGLVIAFIFEWRTALVALGMIPFIVLIGASQMVFIAGFNEKSDAAYKESSGLIS